MEVEHVDVLIVGAGLSGIGAAYHLQTRLPAARPTRSSRRATRIGGTWDLFRYPGIRSDSDMYTLGYSFRPWTQGQGDRRRPVDPRLHPGHRARVRHRPQDPLRPPRRRAPTGRRADARVDGRSAQHVRRRTTVRRHLRLSLHVQRLLRLRRGLHAGVRRDRALQRPRSCTRSSGRDDVDYEGKRVVVIGSGATAVTLVPALAKRAAHVTMLQRSPTYIVSLPGAGSASPTGCARVLPARLGLRAHPLEERAARHVVLSALPPRPGAVMKR